MNVTEDGRILHRNCRHLCRSREPFYSSQPREAPVALQPPDMVAYLEKVQRPHPTKGQSFPTVPSWGDQSKQPTKTPVAIPSKAQPLCTTSNKSHKSWLVVKVTWLFKKTQCLTTPDDCRRQLKNRFFSSFFSLLRH